MPRPPRQVSLVPPTTRDGEDSLQGSVERVTYRSEDTGYAVLRILVPGAAEPITAVGNLGAAQVGEEVALRGRWTRNPKYGPQLEVTSFRSSVPATLAGLCRYLGSGLIHGVGKELARRIGERFGERTVEALDGDGSRLREVDGIGARRAESIRKAWVEQKAIQAAMVFLQSHGASPLLAQRIWKKYGDRTIDVLHHDPYRLAQDVRGIGFKTADRMASNLGIPHDAPARAEAALLHVISGLNDDGNVWVPRDDALARAEGELDVPREAAERAL